MKKLVLAAIFVFGAVFPAQAQPGLDNVNDWNYLEKLKEQKVMVQVIMKHMVIWENPNTGEVTYFKHCREAYYGCRTRIKKLVQYIFRASEHYGMDPYLLAAVAYNESRFNPFVRGGVGERSIFQINPRARWARDSKFLYKNWYRRKCRRVLGNCQEYLTMVAAGILHRSIKKCDSIRAGLGMYNSGRCWPDYKYPRKIRHWYYEFKEEAENIRTSQEQL